jgi:hypothetical protein
MKAQDLLLVYVISKGELLEHLLDEPWVIPLYYRGITLPESGGEIDSPTPLELDIMRSFGWAVVEMEDSLYQRYIRLSASRSLITEKTFRDYLRDMEAKGYVSSLKLGRKRAYRRLLIDNNIGKEIHPQVPLDEMRLALGSLRAKPGFGKKIRTKVTTEVVEDTDRISQEIQEALENWMLKESGKVNKSAVHAYAANMLEALKKSEDELFEYVRTELPGLLGEIGLILRTYGQDFLLLTLRLAENEVRKYKT